MQTFIVCYKNYVQHFIKVICITLLVIDCSQYNKCGKQPQCSWVGYITEFSKTYTWQSVTCTKWLPSLSYCTSKFLPAQLLASFTITAHDKKYYNKAACIWVNQFLITMHQKALKGVYNSNFLPECIVRHDKNVLVSRMHHAGHRQPRMLALLTWTQSHFHWSPTHTGNFMPISRLVEFSSGTTSLWQPSEELSDRNCRASPHSPHVLTTSGLAS